MNLYSSLYAYLFNIVILILTYINLSSKKQYFVNPKLTRAVAADIIKI